MSEQSNEEIRERHLGRGFVVLPFSCPVCGRSVMTWTHVETCTRRDQFLKTVSRAFLEAKESK